MSRRKRHKERRVQPSLKTFDGARNTCAWCQTQLAEDQPVFGLGAKARPGANLEAFRGTLVELPLATTDRTVIAIVTRSGSGAARAGNDLYFMLCSERCAHDLRNALSEEIDVGAAIFPDEAR